jgi:DNA-binding transcriptional LysR family regulator
LARASSYARAAQILADGETAENIVHAEVASPRGLVRLAAPMSFGVSRLAPLLPKFLMAFADISIDLHLSDAQIDLIDDGFEAPIRIAVQPGGSSALRQLGGAPAFLCDLNAGANTSATPDGASAARFRVSQ